MSNSNKESFESIQKYRRSSKSTNNKVQLNQTSDEAHSNENTESVVNSLELAEQFTKALNSLEKLTYENNELKGKNKELNLKIEVLQRKSKNFTLIASTINIINANINDLNKWISSETDENRVSEDISEDNLSIESNSPKVFNFPLDIAESFDFLKGKLGIIKYCLIILSFSCLIISVSETQCGELKIMLLTRGLFFYLNLNIFIYSLLFWVIMITKLNKKVKFVNWISTDCVWNFIFSFLLFFGTIILATNTCGSVGLFMCLVLSSLSSVACLLNGLFLYTRLNKYYKLKRQTIENKDFIEKIQQNLVYN